MDEKEYKIVVLSANYGEKFAKVQILEDTGFIPSGTILLNGRKTIVVDKIENGVIMTKNKFSYDIIKPIMFSNKNIIDENDFFQSMI